MGGDRDISRAFTASRGSIEFHVFSNVFTYDFLEGLVQGTRVFAGLLHEGMSQVNPIVAHHSQLEREIIRR